MEIGEPVAVAAAAEAKAPPRITTVAILNGDDTQELPGGGKQFVNMPKDAKWVDGTHVLNIDRLGQKLRFKVTFDQPGSHGFKLKLKPGASNAAYTGGEKGRNVKFKFEEAEKTFCTDGNGTKVVSDEFFVAVAGKDTFEVVAKDDAGNEVTSPSVTTHRFVYFIELKMTGLTTVATSLGTMTAEFGRHNILMVPLTAVEMEHMPNISTTDTNTFETKARTAYAGSTAPAKEPYVIAIAYTDHLAVKDENKEVSLHPVEVGTGKPDVEVPIVDPVTSKRKFLWQHLVPGETWFVSATYLKDGGTPGTDDVAIPVADCTPVADSPSVPEMASKVKVKVSGLPDGRGKITLKVNWVNRMRAGISLGSGNAICVCTRAWWRNKSTASQNEVMIHELGHQFAMVADGTGGGPDRVSTQYLGKGHVGNHCHEGLAVLPDYSSVSGSCVMFGATTGISAFCANCAPAVVKQDLSAGFTRF